ncbi:MAG TPA: SGNH/GDSL hydrolase family protein [Sphingobacteriaceae bacterium]
MKLSLLFLAGILGLFYQTSKPKVLIIGDSISIGYFPFVKEALKENAEIYHNTGNARFSQYGLEKINTWLGKEHWDVIQFNWGLWDIAYRTTANKGTGALDKINGILTATPEQYRENLDSVVRILKDTGAKLVFVNTTYVPELEPGRFSNDVIKYNRIAEEVMRKHNIKINNLYNPSVKIHKENGLGTNNVHYSKKGYQELSAFIIKGLKEELDIIKKHSN